MDTNSQYYRQVQLLVSVLPLVAVEKCFALKGGTAINLFHRDLPRLSVDIDLVYLPMDDRNTALTNIKAALDRIATSIEGTLLATRIHKSYNDKTDSLRLNISQNGVQIKIELSPVLRGSVFSEELREVSETVEENFGYVEMPLVSTPDLFAGKLCAALDRQHPRDLFDVKFLLENEGITDDIRKTFLVYLISHPRPIAEVLQPTLLNIQKQYDQEFASMAQIEVPLKELETARSTMIEELNNSLTKDEKQFLISFKARKPDWTLLGLENVAQLPAVRWKQLNLNKMDVSSHAEALQNLQHILEISNL